MSLRRDFGEAARAAFPLLWVRTHEYEDAEKTISETCKAVDFNFFSWNCVNDLCDHTGKKVGGNPQTGALGAPPAAQRLTAAIRAVEAGPVETVLVIHNLHKYLQSPEIIQELQLFAAFGKKKTLCVVGLVPTNASIPPELQSLFQVIEHELPSDKELGAILDETGGDGKKCNLYDEDQRDVILEASRGLTRLQASNVYARSAIRNGKIMPKTVLEFKNELLNDEKLILPYHGQETFADIGGLEALKDFLKRAMDSEARRKSSKIGGVLLTGFPGSGKTACAKALGDEVGIPVYQIDFGRTKGSLVGESELRMRQVLRTIDALSPAILICDELEKQVTGGRAQAHETDAHLLGSLLTWLNDRTSDTLFVATANDVSALPPELLRAGRIDATFFVGLPGIDQKRQIWLIYLEKFSLPAQELPDDRDWTGAEIQACCRMADALGLSLKEASKLVIPVASRSDEYVTRLKAWAEGRALDAEKGGVYRRESEPPTIATPGLNGSAKRRVKIAKQ